MPGNRLVFALPVLLALALAGGGSARDAAPPAAARPATAPARGQPAATTPRAILIDDGLVPGIERPGTEGCPLAGVAGLDATADRFDWDEPLWHRQARRDGARQHRSCGRPAPGSFHGSI